MWKRFNECAKISYDALYELYNCTGYLLKKSQYWYCTIKFMKHYHHGDDCNNYTLKMGFTFDETLRLLVMYNYLLVKHNFDKVNYVAVSITKWKYHGTQKDGSINFRII